MDRPLPLRPSWALLALTVSAWGAPPLCADAGTSGWTQRVSFASDGSQIPADAQYPSVSADGRIIAFATDSPLLPDDMNGLRDVYVYDRELQTLVCASTNHSGDYGNGASSFPALSADGRWVAFHTAADNLGGFDLNNATDVYVRDLRDWTIRLVSRPSGGHSSANGDSWWPSVSDSGRYVAFQTLADDLLPGDTNGVWDIYVYDQLTNTQERAGIGYLGGEPNGECQNASISGNGRAVAFQSRASNFSPTDGNGAYDVFVHDLDADNTYTVSRTPDGFVGNGDSWAPSISSDGRHVVFRSNATNFDPRDAQMWTDIYHADRVTEEVELVSVTYFGLSGSGPMDGAHIARDGRFVAFTTKAQLLLEHTGHREVYVRDLKGDKTWLASRPDGAITLSNDSSNWARITGDGSEVVFYSDATFDPADTNGVRDIYVRTMIRDPFAYCKKQETSQGCTPAISSVGFPSARLDAGFTIVVDEVPLDRPAMLFYGLDGVAEIPFKGGILCVGGPLRRTVTIRSSDIGISACDGVLTFDMNAFAAGALGGNPSAALRMTGQQVNAQFWGRDVQPGPHGVFLTNAIQYVVGP